MTKKKLPKFNVGDFYSTEKDGKKILWECINFRQDPEVTMMKVADGTIMKDIISEFADFRRLITESRPAHRPKGSKTRKVEPVVVEAKILTECEGSITTTPPTDEFLKGIMEHQHQDWNESQAQSGALPLADDTCPPEEIPPPAEEHPSKVDLSTFEMGVGHGVGREGHLHRMWLSGKKATGKDLKPTLLRLLEQVGIRGSDAEVETALVLHPESEGRNLMLGILKGKVKGG